MPVVEKMTSEEKRWRSRDYAYALSQAESIKANPDKLKMAIEGAKELAGEKVTEARAMMAVANFDKVSKKNTRTGPATRNVGTTLDKSIIAGLSSPKK